jgi:hypothetical protein
MTAGYPEKAVLAIKPVGRDAAVGRDSAVGRDFSPGNSPGNTPGADIAWTYKRGTAYVTSPILVGDSLYLSTDRGILTNLDANTGEIRYEGGRVPVPASFTASMVAFGDKILQSSEDGDVFVIQAGPEHKVVATNKLGEPIFASPALAGGVIYIRGEHHLYAIR